MGDKHSPPTPTAMDDSVDATPNAAPPASQPRPVLTLSDLDSDSDHDELDYTEDTRTPMQVLAYYARAAARKVARQQEYNVSYCPNS